MSKRKRGKRMVSMVVEDSDGDADTNDVGRKPLNEFHDAYCTYMLLKVKIKHKVYTQAQ